VDAAGKIVLADMNWAPARPEKAVLAYEKGASALIIMNWGLADPNNPVIQMGAVKSQWGNPTPDLFEEIPDIPVITISRYHGEYLKSLCKDGPVSVWLRGESTREWVTAKQPTAYLECNPDTKECLIIGSHLDAWGKSAICNSTGNSLLMELAYQLQKHKSKLKRNIWFVFWDGHEIAEGAGSTYFVDSHWAELTQHCVGYINADNLAIAGTTIPTVEGNSEMKNYAQNAVRKVWGTEGHWLTAYKGGGDSSFFGIGIPYISFATEYTEARLQELNFAVYGPWLHTEYDTVDKVDLNLFEKTMETFVHLVVSLASAPILPYSLPDLMEEINGHIEELAAMTPPRFQSQLKEVIHAASKLQSLTTDIHVLLADAGPDMKLATVNHLLMQTLRAIYPVFRTYHGRYSQDACGSTKVEHPVPKLYEAIVEYRQNLDGCHRQLLWETQVIREMNRLSDALHGAQFILSQIKRS